jgi:hypothetical protein
MTASGGADTEVSFSVEGNRAIAEIGTFALEAISTASFGGGSSSSKETVRLGGLAWRGQRPAGIRHPKRLLERIFRRRQTHDDMERYEEEKLGIHL